MPRFKNLTKMRCCRIRAAVFSKKPGTEKSSSEPEHAQESSTVQNHPEQVAEALLLKQDIAEEMLSGPKNGPEWSSLQSLQAQVPEPHVQEQSPLSPHTLEDRTVEMVSPSFDIVPQPHFPQVLPVGQQIVQQGGPDTAPPAVGISEAQVAKQPYLTRRRVRELASQAIQGTSVQSPVTQGAFSTSAPSHQDYGLKEAVVVLQRVDVSAMATSRAPQSEARVQEERARGATAPLRSSASSTSAPSHQDYGLKEAVVVLQRVDVSGMATSRAPQSEARVQEEQAEGSPPPCGRCEKEEEEEEVTFI